MTVHTDGGMRVGVPIRLPHGYGHWVRPIIVWLDGRDGLELVVKHGRLRVEFMVTLGAHRRGEVSIEAARRQRLVLGLHIGESWGEGLIFWLNIRYSRW